MAQTPLTADLARDARIDAIMAELRPRIEAEVRQLVERAVDVAEAEEFGPSISSSATPASGWSPTSGKPVWRAGKKLGRQS